MTAWPDPDRSDAHEREHEMAHIDCEAPFYCMGCERAVCPRCEDNPGAPSYCPECDWNGTAA